MENFILDMIQIGKDICLVLIFMIVVFLIVCWIIGFFFSSEKEQKTTSEKLQMATKSDRSETAGKIIMEYTSQVAWDLMGLAAVHRDRVKQHKRAVRKFRHENGKRGNDEQK